MPWPEEHKQHTRERILTAAAAALRARGVAGVSIAEIMADAGLTHGGFYAHFGSKEELVSAALEWAGNETIDRLSAAARSSPGSERVDAILDSYVSAKHAEHPERGCPLATLAPELTRAGGQVLRDLGEGIEGRIAWLREALPEGPLAKENAIGLLACMVGGIVLARATQGQTSEAVLEGTRSFARRALRANAEKRPARRRRRKAQ